MKKLVVSLGTLAGLAALSAPSLASSVNYDAYVVNFRNSKNAQSQMLDQKLASVLPHTANVEEVIIDTSTAAKWEKGAHEAFDRDIVPVFNKWVGLPGFAAVVDAQTKQVIGCVNPHLDPRQMANEIERMVRTSQGQAYLSNASTRSATVCPPAHNTPPK